MSECGAIRLRGPSCESPSKCLHHFAHVLLLLSASLTTFAFTTAQSTTAHLNVHNSSHGSGAIVAPLTGYGVVLGTSDARIESGRSDSRSRGFWCNGSICTRDGAILAVCLLVYDVFGFVRVTLIETLAQPREDHRDRWQTGGRQDKEGFSVAHMYPASLGAPACEYTSLVRSLSLSSQL